MIQGEELRHCAAITFGQKGALAAGIISFFDGDRLIEAFPQSAIMDFFFTRKRQLQLIHRKNAGLALSIKQNLPVSAIEDEKGFVGVSIAKMAPQQGKNTILGLDFSSQNTVVIRKADKSPQLFQLTVHVADR